MYRSSASVALTLVLALVSGCGLVDGGSQDGGDSDEEREEVAGAGAGTGDEELTDVEPEDCTGDSVYIEPIETEGVTTEAVEIPEITDGSGNVVQEEGEIPARTIPAQCAEVKPAPGGCLGEVVIPSVTIPEVTIPEVTIPGVEEDGETLLEPVTADAVTQDAVTREGATRTRSAS